MFPRVRLGQGQKITGRHVLRDVAIERQNNALVVTRFRSVSRNHRALSHRTAVVERGHRSLNRILCDIRQTTKKSHAGQNHEASSIALGNYLGCSERSGIHLAGPDAQWQQSFDRLNDVFFRIRNFGPIECGDSFRSLASVHEEHRSQEFGSPRTSDTVQSTVGQIVPVRKLRDLREIEQDLFVTGTIHELFGGRDCQINLAKNLACRRR